MEASRIADIKHADCENIEKNEISTNQVLNISIN